MHYPTLKAIAADHALELLRTLEKLLSFPQNQEALDLRLGDAIHTAQVLRVRS
jgi:hypothetical protein